MRNTCNASKGISVRPFYSTRPMKKWHFWCSWFSRANTWRYQHRQKAPWRCPWTFTSPPSSGWVRLLAFVQSYCLLSQWLPRRASWTSLTLAAVGWIRASSFLCQNALVECAGCIFTPEKTMKIKFVLNHSYSLRLFLSSLLGLFSWVGPKYCKTAWAPITYPALAKLAVWKHVNASW